MALAGLMDCPLTATARPTQKTKQHQVQALLVQALFVQDSGAAVALHTNLLCFFVALQDKEQAPKWSHTRVRTMFHLEPDIVLHTCPAVGAQELLIRHQDSGVVGV